jgi:uncharacterized protein (DUF4415 family)
MGKLFPRRNQTSAAEADSHHKPIIAAVNRCATQNQVQEQNQVQDQESSARPKIRCKTKNLVNIKIRCNQTFSAAACEFGGRRGHRKRDQ